MNYVVTKDRDYKKHKCYMIYKYILMRITLLMIRMGLWRCNDMDSRKANDYAVYTEG